MKGSDPATTLSEMGKVPKKRQPSGGVHPTTGYPEEKIVQVMVKKPSKKQMKEEANQILTRYGIPANNDAGVVIRMGERIKLLEAKNQVYYGGADAKVKEKINFILKLVEDIDQAKSFLVGKEFPSKAEVSAGFENLYTLEKLSTELKKHQGFEGLDEPFNMNTFQQLV